MNKIQSNKNANIYILGIQSFANSDSGACIFNINTKNSKYKYVAISEERLIRKKYNYRFPLHSIYYCMEYFGLKRLNEISFIFSDYIREKKWLRSGPSYNVKEFDFYKKILKFNQKKIVQINHHLAHASSTYYTSNFKESAILIIDGNGSDLETNTFFYGQNNKIIEIDKYKARGIGILYSLITKEILNFGTGGEGKTMGLAPYGMIGKKIFDFKKAQYDQIMTDYSEYIYRLPYTDILSIEQNIPFLKFKFKYKKRPLSVDPTKYPWSRIAYDIQNETEKNIIHLANSLHKKTKSKNISLAGGVALNSVSNEKIINNTKFENLHVFPACSDAGIPFGLCIWAFYNYDKIKISRKKIYPINNAYTGINYEKKDIEKTLFKFKINYKRCSLETIAKLLATGNIIAFFSGGSEYGPRALGNRSILADSRNKDMRDYINKEVKHRETFRPFAPAVLEEDYKKYFKMKGKSPFMLRVAQVKKKFKLDSISHVDQTARVQTVNLKQNKIFYSLLKEFKKITGIGCLLNTSFNDAGEPIVESPMDALITFLGTKIDFLYMEGFLISKNNIPKNLRSILIDKRKKNICKNEKKIKKIILKKFTKKELKKYISSESKKAILNATVKAEFEFKKKITKWKKNKDKIIFFGTYDHTKLILDKFNFNINQILGFYPYKKINDDHENKKLNKLFIEKIKNIYSFLKFKPIIIISTYEYQYDVERHILKKLNYFNYEKIYFNYSRKFDKNKKNI